MAKLGSYSNAFLTERKEIQIGGSQFVMIQTSRIYYGPVRPVEIPYRIELYRVDPADGLEMFVGFVDGKDCEF